MRPEEILKNAQAYAIESHSGNADFIEAAEDAYLRAAETNSIEIAALRAENAKLRGLAEMLLQLDNESNSGDYGGGMCDCKDNDDGAYQSVALAGVLSRFETALNSTTPDPLYQAAPEMLEALIKAKKIIRGWHSMGRNDESEQEMWKIYDEISPEMRPINLAITKAKGE